MFRKSVALGALLAGSVVAGACHDASQSTAPGERPDAAAGQQAVQDLALDPLALGRSIPGFGGFFLDGGVPTVYLTDVRNRAAAERALAGYVRAQGLSPSALRVRLGRYDYAQLERWFERSSPEVLALSGVVFVDLDEANNRVLIGVENAAQANLRSVASRLGIPNEAVVVKEVEPVRRVVTLRQRVRPVQGGLQINFPGFFCTLGFNARRSGQNSFITNSHCTATQGGVQNTPYWQPLQTADPAIAREVADPTYRSNLPGCPSNRRCRRSDAARAAYASGVSFTLGRIARTTGANNNSLTIDGAFSITAQDGRTNFTVGEVVNKVGRTTGWTRGQITNTCVNTGVLGTNIVQLCQTFVSAGVGGGDSGSPVFRVTNGNSVRLYGILWGGSGSFTFVFSPLANVEQELGALTTH